MELLKWDDEKMGMGIDIIDTQHKKLVDIINDLAKAIESDEDNERLFKIVDRLIEYTQYHFTTEEEYFDKFDFAEASVHKSEHKYFIEHFKGIKKGLEANVNKRDKSIIKLSAEILEYLVDWFINHITGSDRKYMELFKKNGLN